LKNLFARNDRPFFGSRYWNTNVVFIKDSYSLFMASCQYLLFELASTSLTLEGYVDFAKNACA
jgi:hypothetical protein